MYSRYAGIVLGFLGCNKSVAEQVINLKQSNNDYDWLGNGMYFWENSPARALEYANHLKSYPYKSKSPIEKPAVIGAVIQLGHCFDLLDYENLKLLKSQLIFPKTLCRIHKGSFNSLRTHGEKCDDQCS